MVLAKLGSLFDEFTAVKATAWQPVFQLALLGDGSQPRFNSQTIRRDAGRVFAGWRKHDFPKAADFVAVCAELAHADRAMRRER